MSSSDPVTDPLRECRLTDDDRERLGSIATAIATSIETGDVAFEPDARDVRFLRALAQAPGGRVDDKSGKCPNCGKGPVKGHNAVVPCSPAPTEGGSGLRLTREQIECVRDWALEEESTCHGYYENLAREVREACDSALAATEGGPSEGGEGVREALEDATEGLDWALDVLGYSLARLYEVEGESYDEDHFHLAEAGLTKADGALARARQALAATPDGEDESPCSCEWFGKQKSYHRDPNCPVHGKPKGDPSAGDIHDLDSLNDPDPEPRADGLSEDWVCDECGLKLPQPSRPAPGLSKLPNSVKCPSGHGPMELRPREPVPPDSPSLAARVRAEIKWLRGEAAKVEADYESSRGRAPGWERATGFVVAYRRAADRLEALLDTPEEEGERVTVWWNKERGGQLAQRSPGPGWVEREALLLPSPSEEGEGG